MSISALDAAAESEIEVPRSHGFCCREKLARYGRIFETDSVCWNARESVAQPPLGITQWPFLEFLIAGERCVYDGARGGPRNIQIQFLDYALIYFVGRFSACVNAA